MPFQLNIRHNIESAADHFAEGEVRTLEGQSVRVGSSPECECCIASDELAPEHFRITTNPGQGRIVLEPLLGTTVFLNQEEATVETELRSGDEIRVGHWTLHFCRLYGKAALSKRADFMALAARVLAGGILLGEVLVVTWLPSRVKSEALWAQQIARLRAQAVLDDLRSRNKPEKDKDELTRAAREAVGSELDVLARYMRKNEEQLTQKQWRRIYDDLQRYSVVLDRLSDGSAFRPIPPVDVDAAVKALLPETTSDDRGGK